MIRLNRISPPSMNSVISGMDYEFDFKKEKNLLGC